MSAAFVPFEPRSDAAPSAIPAAGSDSAINTVPVRSPDRPIRFPHIPSIDQTPPGMALYLQRQNQALRVDTPHLTPGQSQGQAQAAVQPPVSAVLAPPAKTALEAGSARPIPVRPSSPGRESWRSLSTQVEQIAEYLRRRRNELETEQTDLKLNALMQEAALLQEREHLRGQQLNIQMVQATLEILRRQLLELGNSLSESLPAEHQLLQQFETVCQAYYDAAGVARLLDVN